MLRVVGLVADSHSFKKPSQTAMRGDCRDPTMLKFRSPKAREKFLEPLYTTLLRNVIAPRVHHLQNLTPHPTTLEPYNLNP